MLFFGKTNAKQWESFKLTERTDALHNPYRGLYSIYRFYAEETLSEDERLPAEQLVIPEDEMLALVEINLAHFNRSDIPEAALENISRILTAFREKGRAVILRFLYDWKGLGVQTEPETIDRILLHMKQLSDVLHRHEDTIFILQGLFTGSWGEMHNTRFDSENSLRRLALQLSAVTGPTTFLAVRCPNQWRTIFRTFHPLDGWSAYTPDCRTRVGLFNDAMLASATDYGTYGELVRDAMTADRWYEKFTRWDEVDFQSKLCSSVPNGGETIHDNELNDLSNALTELRNIRVTYLNSKYDMAVLDKWRASPMKQRRSVWAKKDGYTYIAEHLGYRFLLRRVHCVQKGPSLFSLELTVENSGFAPCYRKMDCALVLRSADITQNIPLSCDARVWLPSVECTIRAELDVSGMPSGVCQVGFDMHCAATGRPVQFANLQSGTEDSVPNAMGALHL